MRPVDPVRDIGYLLFTEVPEVFKMIRGKRVLKPATRSVVL
jgi:hypothetical protein